MKKLLLDGMREHTCAEIGFLAPSLQPEMREALSMKPWLPFIFSLMIMAIGSSARAELADRSSVSTRYGLLSSDGERKLTLAGRIVKPVIQGNNSLSFDDSAIAVGQHDVAIVQDDGGEACGAQYSIVDIGPGNVVHVYGEFGTCSDLIKVKQVGAAVVMSMPDMSSGKRTVYIYRDGKVTHNGKTFKMELPTW